MIKITLTIEDIEDTHNFRFDRTMEGVEEGANTNEQILGHFFMDVLAILVSPEKYPIEMAMNLVELYDKFKANRIWGKWMKSKKN